MQGGITFGCQPKRGRKNKALCSTRQFFRAPNRVFRMNLLNSWIKNKRKVEGSGRSTVKMNLVEELKCLKA